MNYLNIWVEHLVQTSNKTTFSQTILHTSRSKNPKYRVVDPYHFSPEELDDSDTDWTAINEPYSIKIRRLI